MHNNDEPLPYILYDAERGASSGSESDDDCEHVELLTHKYVPDREPAPFSSSFVEESEEEGEEEEESVGPEERATYATVEEVEVYQCEELPEVPDEPVRSLVMSMQL